MHSLLSDVFGPIPEGSGVLLLLKRCQPKQIELQKNRRLMMCNVAKTTIKGM